jgi:endogenous inhibitor of DNA gyrase (YacG/DUF329 family)
MNSKCPICKKITVYEFRPFCSKRCAEVDLARWFRGDYRIEGGEEDESKKKEDGEDEVKDE